MADHTKLLSIEIVFFCCFNVDGKVGIKISDCVLFIVLFPVILLFMNQKNTKFQPVCHCCYDCRVPKIVAASFLYQTSWVLLEHKSQIYFVCCFEVFHCFARKISICIEKRVKISHNFDIRTSQSHKVKALLGDAKGLDIYQ